MGTKQLNIRIDVELHQKLEQLRKRGYNTSALIRLTLMKMVNDTLNPEENQP